MKKVLIIPDVHCRPFWKTPVSNSLSEVDKIVFLGDYLDGYDYEWPDSLYVDKGLDNFKEIIQLKKDNSEKVSLLLGNHDCTYAVGKDICNCRTDEKNFKEISTLFKDNWKLFQLADEITINGKHFIFSHAGINKTYAQNLFMENVTENNVVSLFNEAWRTKDYDTLCSLGTYSHYRGWGGFSYGSIVWADIREWVAGQQMYGYGIVGHTQLQDKEYVTDQFACLDVRKAFILDESGTIKPFTVE